jgi:hypothetical protein
MQTWSRNWRRKRRRRRRRSRRRRRRTALFKSNNPHLAGGESTPSLVTFSFLNNFPKNTNVGLLPLGG